MRTFTYLNLYGYLTDAVVVNRLLPRGGLLRRLARGAAGAARAGALGVRAGPGADAPTTSSARWWAPRCSTAWPARSSTAHDPAAVLHDRALAGARDRQRHARRCAWPCRSPSAATSSLKKIGLEVIVRVGAQKRTIMLPPALAAYATAGARFEDGAWRSFEKGADGATRRRPAPLESEPTGAARPGRPLQMLDGMRRMAPRELEGQLTNLIREFLLTLRSLIDWYLERLDRDAGRAPGRGHPDRLAALSRRSRGSAAGGRRRRAGSCPTAPHLLRVAVRDVAALAAVASSVVEPLLLPLVAGDQQPLVVAGAHVGVVGGRAVGALLCAAACRRAAGRGRCRSCRAACRSRAPTAPSGRCRGGRPSSGWSGPSPCRPGGGSRTARG